MLAAIVCGMEHSGTTLISDLLRQTGELESGFECGVLLTDSPRSFGSISPFYENMLEGWQISEAELEHCCDTDSFETFYQRLAGVSPLIDERLDMFDKTPRYIAQMDDVLERSNAPIIGIHKDPRASAYSDFRRSGETDFAAWFEGHAEPKRRYMRRCYDGYLTGLNTPERFVSVSLEQLCFASLATCRRIFGHIGREFSIDYLLMDALRYKNTRAKFISADIVLEYRKHLSIANRRRVEEAFSEFEDWFFE